MLKELCKSSHEAHAVHSPSKQSNPKISTSPRIYLLTARNTMEDRVAETGGRESEVDPSASTPSLTGLSSSSSPVGFDPQSQENPTPTMGPDFYELRRRQWLSPSNLDTADAGLVVDEPPSSDAEVDDGRVRLEKVLAMPGAEEDEELWDSSLANVYKGLIGGKRFRKGVKLSLAVS
jgi:hypothetical protein